MSEEQNSKWTSLGIVLIIGITILYFLFKYLGNFLGYILILTGIIYFAYNFFKKNLIKETYIYGAIIFVLGLTSFGLNSFLNYSHCDCYEISMDRYMGEDNFNEYDECLDKWDDEVQDYKTDNKGVYLDPLNYFSERCNDEK